MMGASGGKESGGELVGDGNGYAAQICGKDRTADTSNDLAWDSARPFACLTCASIGPVGRPKSLEGVYLA